ncbi:hypothetical protein NDU88_003411 [Pleurodeles waltl]|uniref:Uncharacterized protein n=1 Tax=Pleurodeles waltl TaxID=8319 RepID=A0AAV7NGL2_PLEWA|nr:hypothetical protein NDU88_003411 [Pleurodeles waltl]
MTHTPEFTNYNHTPGLPNNIMEFSDNEETVPLSSELMDFSDYEETRAFTKNVMDFSGNPSMPKQRIEVSDDKESKQSETEEHPIRNDSLLLELARVAASTTEPDLLFPVTVFPVSNSKVSEEQFFDLPVLDRDLKPATPMPPALSLTLKTPENQQSETEVKVLKNVMSPTRTKELNSTLVLEDMMISTVLSVLLQETIITLKDRAENPDNNTKKTSKGIPFLFIPKEQPFSVNRVADQRPVVVTLCKETITDTMKALQSRCNVETTVSEDHPKEFASVTSPFSTCNQVSTDFQIPVDIVIDTLKTSRTEEKYDRFMFTSRKPVKNIP